MRSGVPCSLVRFQLSACSMAELYTVSFAALSVLSVTTATCPAFATAHSAMVLSMVLV